MPSKSTENYAVMGKDIFQQQIWHKIFKAFNETGLDYILVGAVALVIHGLPRSTLDIDIYVPAKEATLEKVFHITQKLNLHSEQKAIPNIRRLPKLFVNQWICFSYKGQDILDVFLLPKKSLTDCIEIRS